MDLIFDFQILLFYSLIYEHSNWPVLLVRHALVSRRHPDYRTSCILELGGGKMRKGCLQANLTPQPINQSSMMNSSLEALSFMTRSSRAGKQASTDLQSPQKCLILPLPIPEMLWRFMMVSESDYF